MWFHTHKWSKEVDRKQTCEICGKIRIVECPHTWKIIERRALYTYNDIMIGTFIELQCEKCGEVKGERISLRDY